MRKRIYCFLLILSIFSILLATFFNIANSYSMLSLQMQSEVKSICILLSDYLDNSNLDITTNTVPFYTHSYRISLIDSAGNVVFDNFTDSSTLDNHSNRPEIINALNTVEGSSVRFSDTIGERTFYYAKLLNNGYILRVSKTTNDIYSILKGTYKLIILCILLSILICHYIAKTFVKKLISPINNINIDANIIETYEEISPLIKTIQSQKKQLNNQLVKLESRTNTIIAITENMKEGILLFDVNKNILLANQSVLSLLQITHSDYIGKYYLKLIRDINIQGALFKTLNGESTNTNIVINNRVIQVLLSPVYSDKYINGTVALFIDITEQANTEKLRREFSANVSHELRTPLTTILGLSELIYNDMVNEKDIKEFGGKIKAESQRLLTLIEDIIKLSRLDEKIPEESFETFSITPLLNEVITSVTNKSNIKNVNINLISNDYLLTANKQMIFELLFNIVENGIKYNKKMGYFQ